ncbi:FAS-associated death domain protein-like [Lineus longissimus]|uniref:FAS-associated death domain protein-like n=1 Tax=Lineus longissimus TaxID=88925 RepID=UPI002B4C4AD3
MDGKDYSEIDKVKEYRQLLVQLGRNTDHIAFKELKHICEVKKARAEKMKDPIDLFEYLEELGEISANKVDYLIDVLKKLDRIADAELVKQFQSKFGGGEEQYYNGSLKGQDVITQKTVTQVEADDDACIDSDLNAAFEFLKEQLGRKWRELARAQGLSQVDIHSIEDANPRDLKEQSYQALLLWQKKQKTNATIPNLEKDLRKRQFNQMANDIASRKYISA